MPIGDTVDQYLTAFRTRQANQNFLYLLAFYVGQCVAANSSQRIVWLSYPEMIEAIPDNATMFPECFATSVTCVLETSGFFVPLSAIQERLFTDPPDKSVAFSAQGAMRGWA